MNEQLRVWFAAFAAMGVVLGAQAAEKLPTDYGDPANDLASGSVEGLTWTGTARAYNVGADVVLVFTNTTAGACSFEIADKKFATADYLLVGGGGAGGQCYASSSESLSGAGGGAGGMLEGAGLSLANGTYAVTVGKGGTANPKMGQPAESGSSSSLVRDGALFLEAFGGGAGGFVCGVAEKASGANGGCGGGAAYLQRVDATSVPGTGSEGQGKDGGSVSAGCAKGNYSAGGGGAGAAGGAPDVTGPVWLGGVGGSGLSSFITGEEVWYAGGGAGGSSGYFGTDLEKAVAGGMGGGGRSVLAPDKVCVAESGVDSLGGGGAGSSVGYWNDGSRTGTTAGNGGSGVVVVRITSIRDDDPVEGLSFNGESEWYNLGSGENKETVIVFTNVAAAGSFKLERDAVVRVLLVGGGGPGGRGTSDNTVGGGGGAGGMLMNANDGTDFVRGTYQVTVGKGGTPSTSASVKGSNGGDSAIVRGSQDVFRAQGGGAGGNPAQTAELAKGSDGGSGGGGAVYNDGSYVGQSAGAGVEGQGFAGSAANTPLSSGAFGNAGGGGGAGSVGHPPIDTDREWRGGAGGDGLSSDITGKEVWYAGGGAGGTCGYYEDKVVSGGKGGGGDSATQPSGAAYAKNGVDGLGGGGAGQSGGPFGFVAQPGRGGNGVVIVRVKKIYPPEDPLDGVSFTGAAEWYNIGRGKTRETVIVYKNVEEAGTLKLERGVTARVLLVGGGGPGGNGQQTGAGGGGGAGGFVEANAVKLRSGTYTITVGKGGEPKYTGGKDFNNNGNPSVLSSGSKVVFKALGGGGGANTSSSEGAGWLYACGNPSGYCTTDGVNFDYTKCDVASGGGGALMNGWYAGPQYGGRVVGEQGHDGGDCGKKVDGAFTDWQTPGGGGGAGTAAKRQENNWVGGAGGDGKVSDITGDEVYYAGGGAGGAGCYNEHKLIAGGVGGGGSAEMDNRAATLIGEPGNGTDGLGGGGAGSCYGQAGPGGNVTIAPGRGGNGVVIVRITEVLPLGFSIFML